MKIVLDLSKSGNHYHWEDKKELEEYINSMKNILWRLYESMQDDYDASDEEYNRLYDILDMFSVFEIKGDEE